jgi:hypothetical protein
LRTSSTISITSASTAGDLEELAVAPLLWPLAPEHRADVVEFLHARPLIEPVLDIGADHRRRIFRPQRKRRPVAVLEGIHFLAHDIGIRAHAAREELRLLKDRRANFAVAIRAKHGPRRGFDAIPDFGGWGQ